MLHVVELGSFGGDVGAVMSNMRTWLDHQRSQPVIFSQISGKDGPIFRLEFASEREALAFHERVRQGLLTLAAAEPERFSVLDAAEPIERVRARVIAEAERRLGGRA